MPRYYYGVPFLSFAFLCFFSCLAGSAEKKTDNFESAPEFDKAVWAWADKADKDNSIFISRNVAGSWAKPETVSVQDGFKVVPSVTSTGGEDLFAVWTNYRGTQAQLHYRQFKNGVWSNENEYYTGLSSNTAASVAKDNFDILWMVWAGFNGVSDEIYYTTWNGASFATAQAITANDVPDILPVLGIDEATGNPWVQWQQFSETGYKKHQSSWNGSRWTKPIKVEIEVAATTDKGQVLAESSSLTVKRIAAPAVSQTGKASSQSKMNKAETEDLKIEIPPFVTNPESASIHIPGYAVRSLPVRSMSPAK